MLHGLLSVLALCHQGCQACSAYGHKPERNIGCILSGRPTMWHGCLRILTLCHQGCEPCSAHSMRLGTLPHQALLVLQAIVPEAHAQIWHVGLLDVVALWAWPPVAVPHPMHLHLCAIHKHLASAEVLHSTCRLTALAEAMRWQAEIHVPCMT